MTSRELLQRVVRIKRRDSNHVNDLNNTNASAASGATWHIAGTGMLVGSRHILTCAHVIMDVVDIATDDVAIVNSEDVDAEDVAETHVQFNFIGQQVYIDFPANPHLAQLQRATVIEYLPDKPARGDGLYDMALLKLPEDVALTPFCLSWQEPIEHSPVKLIGFPETAAEVGHWYQGKLGYPTTRNWIYVNGDTSHSPWLKGFSGGPVHSVEDGTILGMASMQDGDSGRFIMIPADVILQAFANYISSCQRQERRRLRRLQQKKYRYWMIVGLGVFMLVAAVLYLRLPLYENLIARADTSYIAQNYAQSLRYLGIARWLRPFSAQSHRGLASVWEDSGLNSPDKVEKYYLAAILLDNDPMAKNNLARFYIQQYEAGSADSTVLESAARLLEQAEHQLKLKIRLANSQNGATTMKVHTDMLSSNSFSTNISANERDLSYVIKNRAWISWLWKHYDKALEESQQAIDLYPNNVEAYCLRGFLLEETGNPAFEMWRYCYYKAHRLDLTGQANGQDTLPLRVLRHPSIKKEWIDHAKSKLPSYE